MRENDQSGGDGERLMRLTSTEGKDNQEITGGAEEFDRNQEEVKETGRLWDWTRKHEESGLYGE